MPPKKSVIAETAAAVRGMELSVIEDIRNLNELPKIKEYLKTESEPEAIRLAALHALRRIFIFYLDHHKLEKKASDESDSSKLREWLVQQYVSFQQLLCSLIKSAPVEMQVASIRTMMEFVRREYLMKAGAVPVFGVEAYSSLLTAVLYCPDLDVDITLMLREEVFSKPDSLYQAMLVIRRVLTKVKPGAGSEGRASVEERELVTKNALDVVRMVEYIGPELSDLTPSDCLVDTSGHAGRQSLASSDEYDSDDSLEAMDKAAEGGAAPQDKAAGRKKIQVSTGSGTKRAASAAGMDQGAGKKFRRKTSRAEQALDSESHRRAFSRLWLALMSLGMTSGQHKLVLKHLPHHVLPYLDQPLLLADYLTRSYESGGVVAVLALESLFQVIVKHNLDYPNFFRSLYRLCTVEVFSAKYRTKFMKLLHMSLKSTNLASYLVAAFIKRLTRLALFVPGPVAVYCIAQVTWLLRRHPQCMVLIHRASGTNPKGAEYDETEEDDIEKCNAMSSSLWELEALKTHHYYQVASLAKSLESESSTLSGAKEIPMNIDDFIEQSFGGVMEGELRTSKKNSAMAFTDPIGVFSSSAIDAGLCNSLALFRNISE